MPEALTPMTDSPRISVITICFNAREALRGTIESVNAQTYPELEHILVDGGSPDGSPALIERLARRNVRWVSESDGGIADALNKGTLLARGDYFCYLNAGDVFAERETVARCAARIAAVRPATPAVFFGDYFSSRDGRRRRQRTSARRADFAWTNPVNHQSVFIAASLARGHPYDRRLQLGMDYDLWLRVMAEAPFIKLDFPVAVFALDGRSSDPAWAVHNLVVRRVLWHVNRGSRIGVADILALGARAAGLQARFLLRKLLGPALVRSWRRHRATTQPDLLPASPGESLRPAK